MKKRMEWVLVCAATTITALLAAVWLNRSVTTFAESRPPQRKTRIVIDAGHGGVDGGATSCTGKLESAYNLEIALRLNDLLRLLGFETVMIRTHDESVYTEGTTIAAQKASDLKERVRIANGTEHGLLLSIHQNTFPDGRYHDAVVLYGKQAESKQLAERLQSLLVETLNPGSNRRCKPADGIYLMEHIRCPGVLIECGFLSNVQEEAKLRSPEYQKKLCCVIASGVSCHIQAERK